MSRRARRIVVGITAMAAFLTACTSRPDRDAAPAFLDIAPQLGVTRVLRSGSAARHWILENVGTGCALLDADGDMRLDVFVANAGDVVDGRLVAGPGPALYLQKERGKLVDATADSGMASSAWQTGVAVGDIDNDGDPDVFVGTFGRPLLYRNVGGGRFEEAAAALGIDGEMFASSAAFLDFDRDGHVDLYIAGYVRFDPAAPPNGGRPCLANGVETACGPGHCEAEPDRLYHNRGGQGFTDVTAAMGIEPTVGGYGLGVACGDYDGDGWTDVYVANDTTANFLWRNLGGKRFEDVALWAGAALSDSGQGQAGMGAEMADVDGDLRLDLFVTNYAEEHNTFYSNRGDGSFADRTHAAGFARDSYLLLGWGVRFVDLDLDGDLDGVIANGHVHPQAGLAQPGMEYLQRLLFYRNDGGRLAEVGRELGADAARPRAHRGLAAGDLDDDGDVDLVLTQLDGPPIVLDNRSPRPGNSLSLTLRGTRSNRDAMGARVTVHAGTLRQLREVTRGGSYLSAQDPRLVFGVGAATRVDQVQIDWPAGASETVGPLTAPGRYEIVEGTLRAEPLRP